MGRSGRESSSFLSWRLGGDDASLLLILEPVALALDIDRGRVMQQAVEDGRGDDVIGKDRGTGS